MSRSRVSDYKFTVQYQAGTQEQYRISVYNENWEENRYFLWDRQEGAWYEEGDTSGNWYTAAEPSVLMQSTTGQYITAQGSEMALGDIESITYTPGTPESGSIAVHLKTPTGITLQREEGNDFIYRISVYNENWEENRYFLWDRQEGAWYEEGDTSGNTWYTAAEPSVLMQSTTGQYITAQGSDMALGDIETITYTPGTPGGFTAAAQRIVIEAVRVIIDETIMEVFCSSMQKSRITNVAPSSETGYDIAITLSLPTGATITGGTATSITFQTSKIVNGTTVTTTKTVSNTDMLTVAMDWALPMDFSALAKQETLTAILALLQGEGEDIPEDVPEGVNEKLVLIMQYLGVPASISYTELTKAEIIAIARDCQYGVMGTDWPIPTWLPTGVTEAQVESAAEGLGIPYHEPTQTA